MGLVNKNLASRFINLLPLILLFFLCLKDDTIFSFRFFDYLTINMQYIVIFYWVLKKPDRLGYGLIFLIGIINDVVQNFPIGISSINYLLLCAIAAFIRTRTLMPSLLYDWVFFLIAILIITSVNFTILTIIFNYPIKYGILMFSSFITFLIYPVLSKIFDQITLIDFRKENAN